MKYMNGYMTVQASLGRILATENCIDQASTGNEAIVNLFPFNDAVLTY